MIVCYRILFIPILLLVAPFYIRRMLRRGGYAKSFQHRFGCVPRLPRKREGTRRIWIQAVSVGEAQAIRPIVDRFSEDSSIELIITCTTSTAYKIASDQYGGVALHVGVFPLDFWLFSALAWRRFQPDMALLMETELWPEHIQQAKKRKVPVVLINGRLSNRTFDRYLKVKFFAGGLLRKLNYLLAATEQDYARFIQLGARKETTLQTGNLKFDVEVKPILEPAKRAMLREELGFLRSESQPLVLLGSSTWPGEEALLVSVFERARALGLNCVLLLVPRHMERRSELERLLNASPWSWHMRSSSKRASKDTDIYVADTTGELCALSQVADLVFIGNSMPPNDGGQTPIEAAALGLPIVYGPMMTNFKHICKSLEAAGASLCVEDASSAQDTLLELLQSAERRQEMGSLAKQWHEKNRGAAGRTLDHLYKMLKSI